MPGQDVVLVPLEQSDLPTLQAWFEDEELSARLGGILPLQQYFDYVQSEPEYHGWMALEGAMPVGAVVMEIEPEQPSEFWFLVNPALRSRGYGRHILQKLMAQPEAATAIEWKVGIEADNIASQRCLEAIGLVPESGVPDEEGFVQYVYTRSRSL